MSRNDAFIRDTQSLRDTLSRGASFFFVGYFGA